MTQIDSTIRSTYSPIVDVVKPATVANEGGSSVASEDADSFSFSQESLALASANSISGLPPDDLPPLEEDGLIGSTPIPPTQD